MSRGKKDAQAKAAYGSAYDAIPKSVFATIAWHLANEASGTCDAPGAAESRFIEEWDCLIANGLIEQKVPASIRAQFTRKPS
jgi:hypothetical protein